MKTLTKKNKIIEIYKEVGIKNTINVLASYFWKNILSVKIESYYVFETDLLKEIIINKPSLNFELYKLSNLNDKIDEFANFWIQDKNKTNNVNFLLKKIKYHLANGDECFYVKKNDEIIASKWIGYQKSEPLKNFAKKIGLKDNEVILQRGFVSPKYRRHGLFVYLSTTLMKYAKDKGYRKCYTYVGTANIGSILAHLKMDDMCGFLCHIKIILVGFKINLFPNFSKKTIWSNPNRNY